MAQRLYAAGLNASDGFVLVSVDNRVTVWDTATGQLETALQEKDHLLASYTCVALGVAKAGAAKSKKAKGKGKEAPRARFVAVGDIKGRLYIWDVTKGDLVHSGLTVPGATTADAVSDVVFSPDCSSVFCCSENSKYVVEVSMESGAQLRKLKVGKNGATKLCISADGTRLLAAGSTMSLWNLETGQQVMQFAGHSTPTRGVAFLGETNAHFVSCCEDRFVSLWSCNPDSASETAPLKKKRRKSSPAADDKAGGVPFQRAPAQVLAAPSPPVWISASTEGDSDSRGLVTVCCQDESASLWSVDLAGSSGSEGRADVRPDTVLQNKGDIGGALAAYTSSGAVGSPEEVVLVRNAVMRPVFQAVRIRQDGLMRPKVALGDLSAEGRLLKAGAGGQVVQDGDNEETSAKANDKNKKKEKVHIVPAESAGAAGKPSTAAADDQGEESMTMGERVKALSAKLQENIKEHFVAADNTPIWSKKRSREEQAASAVSLSTVLEQALQSNDNQLLEVVLRNTEQAIVSATVARLPPMRVLNFLNVVVQKFESRPARGISLLVWIRAILDQHAAYLVKVPDLAESLSGLYQIVEARLAVFSKFVKLQGRLEFVVSQVALRASQRAATEEKKSGPAVIFDEQAPQDEASSDEEEEDDEEDKEEEQDSDEEGDQDMAHTSDVESADEQEKSVPNGVGTGGAESDSGESSDEAKEDLSKAVEDGQAKGKESDDAQEAEEKEATSAVQTPKRSTRGRRAATESKPPKSSSKKSKPANGSARQTRSRRNKPE